MNGFALFKSLYEMAKFIFITEHVFLDTYGRQVTSIEQKNVNMLIDKQIIN